MKKNNNKKGFTIVELVIVIAVIAILAAVLIPTFSNVISKANNSAALQEARNVYTEVYADDLSDGTLSGTHNITPPTDATINTYTVNATGTAVTVFNYTATNGLTVNFDGTDWTVS